MPLNAENEYVCIGDACPVAPICKNGTFLSEYNSSNYSSLYEAIPDNLKPIIDSFKSRIDTEPFFREKVSIGDQEYAIWVSKLHTQQQLLGIRGITPEAKTVIDHWSQVLEERKITRETSVELPRTETVQQVQIAAKSEPIVPVIEQPTVQGYIQPRKTISTDEAAIAITQTIAVATEPTVTQPSKLFVTETPVVYLPNANNTVSEMMPEPLLEQTTISNESNVRKTSIRSPDTQQEIPVVLRQRIENTTQQIESTLSLPQEDVLDSPVPEAEIQQQTNLESNPAPNRDIKFEANTQISPVVEVSVEDGVFYESENTILLTEIPESTIERTNEASLVLPAEPADNTESMTTPVADSEIEQITIFTAIDTPIVSYSTDTTPVVETKKSHSTVAESILNTYEDTIEIVIHSIQDIQPILLYMSQKSEHKHILTHIRIEYSGSGTTLKIAKNIFNEFRLVAEQYRLLNQKLNLQKIKETTGSTDIQTAEEEIGENTNRFLNQNAHRSDVVTNLLALYLFGCLQCVLYQQKTKSSETVLFHFQTPSFLQEKQRIFQ